MKPINHIPTKHLNMVVLVATTMIMAASFVACSNRDTMGDDKSSSKSTSTYTHMSNDNTMDAQSGKYASTKSGGTLPYTAPGKTAPSPTIPKNPNYGEMGSTMPSGATQN